MSLPSSPYVDILAQTVADGMIECGYWDDCTKEKILWLATSYADLEKWYLYALKSKASKGEVINITIFPDNPTQGQIAYLAHNGTTYRYMYRGSDWSFVEARPSNLF
ncbi:hypothetical protein [Paenibacillus sp. HGF5]|uniref:hypothetical protein n=1 Tax=Paenibacillus sp. HGF5 TaxID=908341 RepID=UPI00055C154F|nr:hypothetical protein [Paenibacillus sp. HGF5]